MPGLRTGQMELPLQIGSGDVDVAHRHLGIEVPEQLHERRQTYPCAYHLTGICVPELVRNDAGADTDGSDNIGKVRTELLDEGLPVSRASQKPAVKREWVERTEEAQTMNDLTNKRVYRDHALGLQLPERNVNAPTDPGRHYGQDQHIHRCAFRYGGSAAGHWRADHCGGAVPAELTDPAG